MAIARSSGLLGKITILVLVGLCVNTAVALDGSGTEENPWLIQSLEDFNDFAADANYWDDYTRLETDVNLAGMAYTTAVIAPDTDNTNYTFEGTSFSGIFDGAGHRVNNLTIDDGGVGNDYLGLFGYTENGQIENIVLENVVIITGDNSHRVGGLVGNNDTTAVTNCHLIGEIGTGRYSGRIGGLIGRNIDGEIVGCHTEHDINVETNNFEIGGLIGGNVGGLISNCYTTGAVSGNGKTYELGGLIGRCNDGTITDCYTTGNVHGYGQFGGLVGHNVDNIVTNCYATGTLTGGDWGTVGGLIGENAYAQINNCYALGEIIGEHYSYILGGLIGYNNGSAGGGTVMNCFAIGTVTGGDFSHFLGGLIGYNAYATTINSYATGAVISGDSSGLIGGLVGENYYSNINDCYTKASVVSGDNSDSIGGLVGFNRYSINQEIGVIRNCYAIGEVLVGNNSQNLGGFAGYINNIEHINGVWNIETSGLIDGVGNQNTDPAGVTGKTTAEMQTQSTFTNWNFIHTWNIGENQTYPYLRVFLAGDINKDGIVNFFDFAIEVDKWMEGEITNE
jgi:hypothetical protein